MSEPNTKKDTYHHGHLREELIRRGLDALEKEGAEALSLRALAESAGVSKTAPYRHFQDKDMFLGALADEGYRLLHEALTDSIDAGRERRRSEIPVGAMGRAYMAFALARPALYRLMNSSLMCRMPAELTGWARKSLLLLAGTLAAGRSGAGKSPDARRAGTPDLDAAAAAWAYIHGLTLIRIDGLFPADLPQPNWDRLVGVVPEVPAP